MWDLPCFEITICVLTCTISVCLQLKGDEERFHKDQDEFKVAHSKSWEVDIEEKRRFLKTLPDKEAFETAIKARRTSEFAQLQVRLGPGLYEYSARSSHYPDLLAARVCTVSLWESWRA